MRGVAVIAIGVCLSTGTALIAMAADNPPFNVKPGLWEFTIKGESGGTPSIPPEALSQMTPEQRARMEAMMKGAMAKAAEPHTRQQCVTQQDIDKGFDKFDDKTQGRCTRTVTSRTSTLVEGRVQCTAPNNASGSYRFEAPNPQSVIGRWDMAMGDAGHGMRMKQEMQGKWLSADCGSVKPHE